MPVIYPELPPSPNIRPTIALIDLARLTQNLRTIKSLVGDTMVMVIVKANAYGHGAVECSKALETAGADWFGVAMVEEGIELRHSGISKPILCLGGIWPGDENRVLKYGITPVILTKETAENLNRTAAEQQRIVDIHIKLDTGMGRVGVPVSGLPAFIESIRHLKNLRIDGVMTHFAAANDPVEDAFTAHQIRLFNEGVAVLNANGIFPTFQDMANSPAFVRHPDSHGNMIRPGGSLYGFGDILPAGEMPSGIRPVMSLHTKIAFVKTILAGNSIGYGRTFVTKRDSVIATIPVGYNDGFPRCLSNKGSVLINDLAAPIVGRVSMDWTIVDVTEIPDVNVGDDVILMGENDGGSVYAEDIAELCGTISYEITCGISLRIPRIYIKYS